MARLTSKQRAHLKSLAHPLKPLFQIGKEGVTATLLSTVDAAFQTRELFKVKILDTAPADVSDIAAALAEGVPNVAVVQIIGRTVVLFRAHPEKPEIRLPR